MIGKITSIIIIFVVFFAIFYFFANAIDYYDPLNNCYIKINGNILSGNEDTIRSALKEIKKTNIANYHLVCKYIDKIIENQCLNSDPHFGNPTLIADGCYIKGSKFIYLKSEENETEEIVKKRVELIQKYSGYSERFWNNK